MAMIESLTKREQEIVAYLARGLSNKEIAQQLYLAEKTVRWYNTQIYAKLAVRGRKECIARAGELGFLANPPAPTPALRHTLPLQATPFVGRQRELAGITSLLADADVRLITILAPGGMGKTRLALEVATARPGQHPDGVFFVSLDPLNRADDLALAIAEQLGFSFYGADTPGQQVLNFLQSRSMLLVLDNFEHLLDAAHYVDDIIRTAPGIRIITTSRERLHLQRETVYMLRGLDVPGGENVKDIAAHDAVTLFIQQARRVRPDFELQTGELKKVLQICHLTAGMPLALELAAGWLDTLSLDQIAAEIQRGIDIFETEIRDVPERHRSIRATFERTWQRLAEADQQLFMRLSIFRGGFTAEAALAIAGADRRRLRRLHNQALFDVLASGRSTMHELLRQFGAEKLEQAHERSRIQSQHTTYFANFMAERQQDMHSNRQLEAVEWIDQDFENVRLAWLNALQEQLWDALAPFLESLRFYCEVRTRSQDGIELLQQAVQAVQSAPATAAHERILGSLLARLAWFYYDVGLAEKSMAAGDEAIRILRQHNHPADLLVALYSRQAVAISYHQHDIGAQALQEGLHLARSLDDPHWEGHFLVWSAIAHIVRNNLAIARPLVEEGMAIFERLGNHWGRMRAYTVLGDLDESQQQYERAGYCFQQSLRISESFGHNFTIGANNTHLASIAFLEGNDQDARQYLRAALQAFWEAGYLWASPFPLAWMARMLADHNERVRAVEILATIDPHLTAFRRNAQLARALRDELSAVMQPDQFAAAWASGQRRDLGTLITNVLAELS